MTPEQIAAAVHAVCGVASLHDPFIDDVDAHNVDQCVREEPVGYGYIRQLEEAVKARTGRQHAIAVSSGTAAIHLALVALGIQPQQQVIVPTLTFAGVAAAIRYCGGLPFLYDGLVSDFAGSAKIILDLLGHPSVEGWGNFGWPVIEDAAAALGSHINGQPCGAFGDVSIISFNNNKIVTSNGGGMLLTSRDDVAAKARHLATTAKIPSLFFYEHDAIGFNYRMSNIGAALAIGQVARLDEIIKRKTLLAELYQQALPVLYDPPERPGWNYWMNTISVQPYDLMPTMHAMQALGVSCRALYTPLHLQMPYQTFPRAGSLSASESMRASTICIPSGKTACENAGV